MRVVHLITTIERGGAENAVFALANIQVEKGYEVTVIPLKGKLELFEAMQEHNINVDTSLISKNFLAQIRVMRRKYREGYIFHAHLSRAELLIRLSKSHSRFYVTRHNTERFFPKSNKYFSIMLSRFVLQKSKGVISISRAVKQFLYDSHEISTRISISVIYYGYKKQMNNVPKKQINVKLLNPEIALATIGRLAPQKNMSLLIDFAKRIQMDKVCFQLQIAGEGPDRFELEKKVRELNLSQKVEFLGKLSDIAKFLMDKDFFIFTSNYEGLGLALLEAMDAGLPIIAPRNSAIPEVIGENHPGLFISGNLDSLYDTFMLLLKNSSIQQEALAIQESRLNLFNMENYFASHHFLYSGLQNSGRT
jgi:glycosyltransferase involved in cell wall biosynthesis